jgi:hypothetical protein
MMQTMRVERRYVLSGESPGLRADAQLGGGKPVTGSGWIVVRDKAALRSMLAWIRAGERREPVIAVAAVDGTDHPVLSCAQVRSVVGEGPRVYAVSGEFLLDRLQAALGPLVARPADSVRVWWPGVGADSRAGDHPLVLALDSESSEVFLEEFARGFDLSRPRVRAEIKLMREAGFLDATRLTEGTRRAQNAETDARAARRERDRAVKMAEEAQARARTIAELPVEEQLHVLMVREWLEGLTVEDRRQHPLRYVLSQQFVQAVESQPQLRIERVAWVCAMVACGYAAKLASLEPHQMLSGAQGSPQIERADGAKAWRCRAVGAMDGGPRLHYWLRTDQTVEFHDIGAHDHVAMQ